MQEKKKNHHRFIIGLFLCLFMAILLTIYVSILERELAKDTIHILQEVSAQSVATVNNKIDYEFTILNELSNRISAEDHFDLKSVLEEMKISVREDKIERMGIILPNGRAYTTDDNRLYLGDREYFKESMQGRRSLSTRLVDRVNQDSVIIFSIPVYEQEEVCAVLYAVYNINEMRTLLEVTAFNGEGYTYLVEKNGDAVVDSASPNSFQNFTNVYLSLREASSANDEAAKTLQSEMESKNTGYIRFHNKVEKYMYYAPIDINNWYVLNVVPVDVMNTTKRMIMIVTYVLIAILMLVFLLIALSMIGTERQKKKELSNILYVDTVTGGFSYARFCVEAQRLLLETDKNAAYIIMDIDKFKIVNELYGYEEGNRMLQYVWSIWRKFSRDKEIHARYAADRFVAIWFYDKKEELGRRIEEFQETLQVDIQKNLNGYTIQTTVGIYLIKDRKEPIQKMMNYAIMASATVKGREDLSYAFFDDNYKEQLLENKKMEDEMKIAYRRDEFIPYYQPKYDVHTQKMIGAEALIRWKKKDGSIIMPGRFIPLAEKNGFIHYLDGCIFEKVCRQQKKWLEKGYKVVPISVNLSQENLYNTDFLEDYQKIIKDYDLPPGLIQLELTESAFFENQEVLSQIIDRLHLLGFRILMDDFGTGYSSLMMLKSLPFDILKLDKSFVDDFDDKKGEKIITSVIKLAQSLQIEVTAEGVETEEQYNFLRDLGCDMIQGYYFAKPMSSESFEELLEIASV